MENFDQLELEKFTKLADQWWDPNGKFKPLHLINPLRTSYIEKRTAIKDSEILDIGCGGGILSELLCQKGGIVTAIDLADGPLNVAKIRQQKSQLPINYRKISTTDLVKEGKQYDVITCLEMLEHVPDPSIVVNECAQLCKSGGHLFFSTINRNLKSFIFAILGAEYILNILPQGTHEFEKLIKPSEMKSFIDSADLKFEEVNGMSYLPFLDIVRLTDDPSVNYIIHATKR
ncbi:MAG: bifunctional 2-polyprenyl-6-hydroxyphenol methylase/3-demethylubiquinol 3-O-methyltransferase UbiG [SAR86 cluster bacterium]|uniref:Ubiquinone biosynthesis O-methyltransferase n=1 Tax=SAR86 cluster bacterium TaxID=2030880 RepID=A0A520MTG8_9GAMM|nr:MAG: bifunctional 2-polyprenyl-6-hydroxyphenol methylase/3-demethylubiquinol 3-O-methyltransferase UbiG [SAR86 cluster bacterium]